MTCIVGLRSAKGCVIGGDSLGSDGWTGRVRRDVKAFNLGEHVAIGFTTSYRMGQILRYHVEISRRDLGPLLLGELNAYEWAVKEFIPKARTQLKEHGFAKVEDGRERGGTFLLAVGDRLLLVDADFQVGEPSYAYEAVGSGEQIAVGAMRALLGDEETADPAALEKCGRHALQIAADFVPSVRGPFTFVSTRPT